MSPLLAVPLFLGSLAATLVAAGGFARRLDRLGVRFGFPEALIGLLTALAADGPELASALFALAKGAHSVGVGVLVGSNAFNLAAMIGVSGLLAGSVCLPRATLLLEGLTGVAIMLIAIAVLLGGLAAPAAAALVVLVVAPYLLLVIRGPELLHRRRAARSVLGAVARALEERTHATPERGRPASSDPAHHLLALMVVDVTAIIVASAGMVQSALALGDRWQISRAILGVLVLAPLTSIPNALTGVRLGLAGRSAALVGETFNSNTINLAAGVVAPALFTTVVAASATAKVQLAWLAAMTGLCLALLARRRGMRRAGAAALVIAYLGFVAFQLFAT
jgi:cation:H+ antiporter